MRAWPRRRETCPAAARGRGATAAVSGVARWRALTYGALLAALPLAQAVLDRRWLFDGPGRDPWIYYGYFRFARVYLEEAASAYYSSRLSVILPGHLVRAADPGTRRNGGAATAGRTAPPR